MYIIQVHVVVLTKYNTTAEQSHLFGNVGLEFFPTDVLANSEYDKFAIAHPFSTRCAARIRAQHIIQYYKHYKMGPPYIVRQIKMKSYEIVKLNSI